VCAHKGSRHGTLENYFENRIPGTGLAPNIAKGSVLMRVPGVGLRPSDREVSLLAGYHYFGPVCGPCESRTTTLNARSSTYIGRARTSS
jgi:hypothetical protein